MPGPAPAHERVERDEAAEAVNHVADPLEIEVKIRFADAEAARRAILAAGGVERRARHFEENRLLDTASGDLVLRSALLRVRRTGDGLGVLTWKEKVVSEVKGDVRR